MTEGSNVFVFICCTLAVFTGMFCPVPLIPAMDWEKRGLDPQSKQCFMLLGLPFSAT